MRVLRLLIPFLLVCAPGASSQVLLVQGVRTEFRGLHNWSPQHLVDTLQALTPGQPMHQCAVTLRTRLGFPEAAVTVVYDSPDDTLGYVVVTVVEPADSQRVRRRPQPTDSFPLPTPWTALARAADSNPRLLDAALLAWQYIAIAERDSASQDIVRHRLRLEQVEPLWTAIQSGTEETALRLLATDRQAVHRRAAAAILVRFPNDDKAWRALVTALTDPDEAVTIVAARVLEEFTNRWPRRVNWAPATPAIRAVLDGTSLFHFALLVRALDATAIDSTLAPTVLANGGRLLLDYATAQLPYGRAESRRLLRRLSGFEAGADGAEWQRWIAALH